MSAACESSPMAALAAAMILAGTVDRGLR
jgi:hypothetical protein